MSDYNGWKNYATWNVNLWIDNEYQSYMARLNECRNLTELERPIIAADAERIATDLLMGSTPDLKLIEEEAAIGDKNEGFRWCDVDWAEIAEHWQAEMEEEKTA